MGGPGSGRKPKVIIQTDPIEGQESKELLPNMFLTITADTVEGTPAMVVSSVPDAEGVFYNTYVLTVLPFTYDVKSVVTVNYCDYVNMASGFTYHVHTIPGEVVAKCDVYDNYLGLALIKLTDCKKYNVPIPLISEEKWKKVKPGARVVAVTSAECDDIFVSGTSASVWSRWYTTEKRSITKYLGYFAKPAFIVLTDPAPVLYEIAPSFDAPSIRRFLSDAGLQIS